MSYDAVPVFWTIQYLKRLDYVGHASEWDEIVPHGDPGRPEFIAYYVKDGHVAAAAGLHRDRDMAALIELFTLRRRTGRTRSAPVLFDPCWTPAAPPAALHQHTLAAPSNTAAPQRRSAFAVAGLDNPPDQCSPNLRGFTPPSTATPMARGRPWRVARGGAENIAGFVIGPKPTQVYVARWGGY